MGAATLSWSDPTRPEINLLALAAGLRDAVSDWDGKTEIAAPHTIVFEPDRPLSPPPAEAPRYESWLTLDTDELLHAATAPSRSLRRRLLGGVIALCAVGLVVGVAGWRRAGERRVMTRNLTALETRPLLASGQDVQCPTGARVGQGGYPVCIDTKPYPGGTLPPRTGLRFREAEAACRARGARLCMPAEWRPSCHGDAHIERPLRREWLAGSMLTGEGCDSERRVAADLHASDVGFRCCHDPP
jgi:hypothetical protein